MKARLMYQNYVAYCHARGYEPLSWDEFMKEIEYYL